MGWSQAMWAWRPLFLVRVVFSPPFRKGRGLDRDKPLDLSEMCYENVRVVTSTVKSDHCAIIAYCDDVPRCNINKRRFKRRFRQRTPVQHDHCLQSASHDNLDFCSATDDVQTNFDQLYQYLHDILNRFYPERETTVTT